MSASATLALALLAALGVAVSAPPGYRVVHTEASPEDLLGADEKAWEPAATITWGPSEYSTSFRALWTAAGLSLRWDATDPNPWHTMTHRDDHIWDEEVVEVFIDLDRSGRDYYELEVNPANVVCDLRMIAGWPNQEGDIEWDLAGLETRVHSLSDESGRKTGWTATAFLPWGGFRSLPSARTIDVPPQPGDEWRFNVFRIKRPGGPDAPQEDAVFAAWSPPAVKTFHDARAFRPLIFEAAAGSPP